MSCSLEDRRRNPRAASRDKSPARGARQRRSASPACAGSIWRPAGAIHNFIIASVPPAARRLSARLVALARRFGLPLGGFALCRQFGRRIAHMGQAMALGEVHLLLPFGGGGVFFDVAAQ